MSGCIWAPPDCNRFWQTLEVTTADVYPASLCGVSDRRRRREPRWIFAGGVKVTEACRLQRDRHLASGDLCRESTPLGQGCRASLLVDLPRDEMALLIELVVDLGVN